MKVKCEICGEMVEQKDMSKSYKRRCKKCVAELTKISRDAAKQNGHIPVGAGAKSALPASDDNTLLHTATVFMQGMLSNPNLCNPRHMTEENVVTLARNAMICAKALRMVFEKENKIDTKTNESGTA